ncbi:MAG: 1-pyrroline-5-carboxylate dehydrogenase, partial [Candidatus Cloacimonetes bacterium]|nr:1-pyrroline-5-carboxylate dehydrogenase [Candidatus Cloacimonadota bacterium]
MFFEVPVPKNEAILSYAPGTPERELLQKALADLGNDFFEIPAIIGGKEVFSQDTGNCIEPHAHGHILAKYHKAGE